MIVNLPPTAHSSISYDDTLAANGNHASGAVLAQSVLDYCEYDYSRLAALFGVVPRPQNLPILVTIIAGAGEAPTMALAPLLPGRSRRSPQPSRSMTSFWSLV